MFSIFSVWRRSRSDVSHLLSEWMFADLTDVTLVSEDTYRRLYWCDPYEPDDPDDHDEPDEPDDSNDHDDHGDRIAIIIAIQNQKCNFFI